MTATIAAMPHSSAHRVHLLARSLVFGLSQLAVMVGIHQIEVLDVRGEEFVLADCAVLVGVSQFHHHAAAPVAGATLVTITTATAGSVRTTGAKTLLVRCHEFATRQGTVVIGVLIVKRLTFMRRAIG